MRTAALLPLIALLAGCGLKGDLYLPAPQAPVAQPAPSEAPADEESQDTTGAKPAPKPQ